MNLVLACTKLRIGVGTLCVDLYEFFVTRHMLRRSSAGGGIVEFDAGDFF